MTRFWARERGFRKGKLISSKSRTDSQWKMMWRRFRRSRLGKIGLCIVGVLLILSVFAPFFSPYGEDEQELTNTYLPPQRIHFFDNEGRFHFRPFTYRLRKSMDPETYVTTIEEDTTRRYSMKFFVQGSEYKLFGIIKLNLHLFGVEKGGSIYLFGTDQHGRDLFSRILYGGRISLMVAILGAIVTGIMGSLVGAISGYYGGVIDLALQRVVELIRVFPQLALFMALSVALPATWPPVYILYGIVMIFALLSWPLLAREIRGKVLSIREQDFVMAAKSIGASDMRIIVFYLLPQTVSHIIVSLTVCIPLFILAESMLSFLGLGIQPPMVSWGVLLNKAQQLQVLGKYPWILIPGLFIMITVLGFNFLGDGLRDAADPFSRR